MPLYCPILNSAQWWPMPKLYTITWDPISLYLFILGSEVLMRLINKEISLGRLSAVKVSTNAHPISKLCYANDLILFCKAKMSKLNVLKLFGEILLLVWTSHQCGKV